MVATGQIGAEKGGIVCNTGIIGGVYALKGFDPIKEHPAKAHRRRKILSYPAGTLHVLRKVLRKLPCKGGSEKRRKMNQTERRNYLIRELPALRAIPLSLIHI